MDREKRECPITLTVRPRMKWFDGRLKEYCVRNVHFELAHRHAERRSRFIRSLTCIRFHQNLTIHTTYPVRSMHKPVQPSWKRGEFNRSMLCLYYVRRYSMRKHDNSIPLWACACVCASALCTFRYFVLTKSFVAVLRLLILSTSSLFMAFNTITVLQLHPRTDIDVHLSTHVCDASTSDKPKKKESNCLHNLCKQRRDRENNRQTSWSWLIEMVARETDKPNG